MCVFTCMHAGVKLPSMHIICVCIRCTYEILPSTCWPLCRTPQPCCWLCSAGCFSSPSHSAPPKRSPWMSCLACELNVIVCARVFVCERVVRKGRMISKKRKNNRDRKFCEWETEMKEQYILFSLSSMAKPEWLLAPYYKYDWHKATCCCLCKIALQY